MMFLASIKRDKFFLISNSWRRFLTLALLCGLVLPLGAYEREFYLSSWTGTIGFSPNFGAGPDDSNPTQAPASFFSLFNFDFGLDLSFALGDGSGSGGTDILFSAYGGSQWILQNYVIAAFGLGNDYLKVWTGVQFGAPRTDLEGVDFTSSTWFADLFSGSTAFGVGVTIKIDINYPSRLHFGLLVSYANNTWSNTSIYFNQLYMDASLNYKFPDNFTLILDYQLKRYDYTRGDEGGNPINKALDSFNQNSVALKAYWGQAKQLPYGGYLSLGADLFQKSWYNNTGGGSGNSTAVNDPFKNYLTFGLGFDYVFSKFYILSAYIKTAFDISDGTQIQMINDNGAWLGEIGVAFRINGLNDANW